MDITNYICKASKKKTELIEKSNLIEVNEKTENVNFEQKDNKSLPQKLIKNDYIMLTKDKICNDIKNRRRRKNNERNLIKEMKMVKYFIATIKKINFLLINCMIFINLFIPIFGEKYEIRGNSFLNEITIKIIGTDTQNILNGNFMPAPDEILIEGNPCSLGEKNTVINLTNYENNITMRWNSPLTDCWRMFNGLSNLIEIDLTNFDFSEVTRMNTMFQNCFNLEYINFNNNIEKKLIVDDMSYMFDKCRSLKSLDLSKLDTYNLKKMSQTFSNCWSLTSLNFNGFNTSSVITFMGMFNNCSSLKSIDLSSFDTSQVTIFNSMFYFCSSLTSINLSSFRTSKAFTMDRMFFECNKLKSLDLSNFDTSQTEYMSNLFYNCTELTSLDISNFNIGIAKSMENMFFNCNNLQYINISNFKGINNTNIDNLFKKIPENVTYCFNSENEIEIPEIIEQLKSKKCSINDCSDDWQKKEKKLIADKNMCVYDCLLDDEYKNEFKNQCYRDCPNGTYLSPENNKCIIICGEDLPFEQNEECVLNCSAQDFFNNICKINNQNINAKENMINTILNEIVNGYADLLLSKVSNEEKKII